MYVGIIAHVVFWVLLAAGWDELPRPLWLTFLAAWIVGYVLARTAAYGGYFAPSVAVVDVVLVFLIFKGDVRLN